MNIDCFRTYQNKKEEKTHPHWILTYMKLESSGWGAKTSVVGELYFNLHQHKIALMFFV